MLSSKVKLPIQDHFSILFDEIIILSEVVNGLVPAMIRSPFYFFFFHFLHFVKRFRTSGKAVINLFINIFFYLLQ